MRQIAYIDQNVEEIRHAVIIVYMKFEVIMPIINSFYSATSRSQTANSWATDWKKPTIIINSNHRVMANQMLGTGSTMTSYLSDSSCRISYDNVPWADASSVLTKLADHSYSINWNLYCTTANIEINCTDFEIAKKFQFDTIFDPKSRIKDIISSRHAPAFFSSSRKALPPTSDIRELRARETLRRVIGEDKYQRLQRDGFVAVRGKDNLNYQIFPGGGFTSVFENGRMIERLCVVMQGTFPPTDSIIMRYLMLLNNPAQFRKLAIPHGIIDRKKNVIAERTNLSLTEIYRDLKKKVA